MKSTLNKNGESSVISNIYSYSTLKSMTKDELIDLLGIAQQNYECSQNGIYNITKYAKKLDKALDKAIDELNDENCPSNINDQMCKYSENYDCKKCWRDSLMKGENE